LACFDEPVERAEPWLKFEFARHLAAGAEIVEMAVEFVSPRLRALLKRPSLGDRIQTVSGPRRSR